MKKLLLEIVLGLVPIPGPGFSQLCTCMHLTAMELNLGMRLATYFTPKNTVISKPSILQTPSSIQFERFFIFHHSRATVL